MSEVRRELGHVTVRPRRPADVPALGEMLREQQPTSRYPFRDPLPIPVEQFLHAHDALAAFTAELDGESVGHICFIGARDGFPGATEMNRTCGRAHGCDIDALAWISAFFVGLDARGLGIGRRLLRTAVDAVRSSGLRPCLEVLPVHPGAMSLYRSTGWRDVMQLRPEWLRSEVGDQGPDVTVMVLTPPS